MSALRRECTHLDQINDVEPSAEGCEECLRIGDTWVHLRKCLICGRVACCNSSASLRGRNDILFRAALSPAGTARYVRSIGG